MNKKTARRMRALERLEKLRNSILNQPASDAHVKRLTQLETVIQNTRQNLR